MTAAVAEQLDLLAALESPEPPAFRRRARGGPPAPAVGGAVVWTDRLRHWVAPRNRRALGHLTAAERAAAEAHPLVWLNDLHAYPSSCTACGRVEGDAYLQDISHGRFAGRRGATGVCTAQSLLAAHCQSGAAAALAAREHTGKGAARVVESTTEQLAATIRDALAHRISEGEVADRLAAGGMTHPGEVAALIEANRPRPVVHALMPHMGLACGAPFTGAARARGRVAFTTAYEHRDRITCPDCLAAGDLPAMARAMQGRQA